jgi:hypothetical protein
MRKLKKVIISLSLAVLITCGLVNASQNVYGQSGIRQLVGAVISVDLNTRTMKVMDRESKKIYTVKVPKNKQINLSYDSPASSSQAFLDLERVMRGYVVNFQVTD